MTEYKDLADNSEDDRITEIGKTVMEKCKIIGFVVDDETGKLDRYLIKLQKQFPGIVLIDRGVGPVVGTVWAKVWICRNTLWV